MIEPLSTPTAAAPRPAPPQAPAAPASTSTDQVTLAGKTESLGLMPKGLAAPAPTTAVGETVDHYLTPSEILKRCQDLAKKYPDRVELVMRDYKTSGYDGKNQDLQGPAPLYYLRLGPKTDDRDKKVGVFEFASPHAREWINPMIMMELAEQLAGNYDPKSTDPKVMADTQLLQKLDIFIAPETNPDGTNFSMNDDPDWRKNLAPDANGDKGVDVNRNYPLWWEPNNDTSAETYPGPKPLSEPEARSTADVVEEHPNIRFVCDWHSYSEEVRRPWGVSDQDLPVYETLHQRMVDAIAKNRGSEYKATISTVANGTSDDYFYHHNKVFSMLVEDGKAFHPDVSEGLKVKEDCVPAAREILTYAAEYEQKNGLASAHPPAVLPDPPAT